MKTASLAPKAYLDIILQAFEVAGNPEVAEQQMRYLKNHFDFYGMKAPVWLPIVKAHFKEHGLFNGDELISFARLCYEDAHREVHYLALEMVEKQTKNQSSDFIDFLEELILENSWWDSVDWISKFVSIHFKNHPDLTIPVTSKWMDSNEMWLQRVAIIFQRYYKKETNEKLLFKCILQVAHSKEFFLQKGAGWALRDYAKINPQAVIQFVNNNPQLSSLTKREALRHLKKKGML